MMTDKIKLAAVLVAGIMANGFALADGDIEQGKKKAYTCTGCHGITSYFNAYPAYHVPRIAGQNYQYLVNALKGYQSGERKHPTMNAQAMEMTAKDIEDIAAYLASVSKEG
jgi:cytochrome c553